MSVRAVVVVVVGVLLVPLALLGTSCATAAPAPPAARVIEARAETIALVEESLLRRVVTDAPSVMRSGIARWSQSVPLDEQRVSKLPAATARNVSNERLLRDVAARLETLLNEDEVAQARSALAAQRPLIEATLVVDPPKEELAAFLADAHNLSAARRDKVQALVELTLPSPTLDKLTRSPVRAAARAVTACLPDDDEVRRADLMRIANSELPGSDARSLVMAFAFLWRNLDDQALDDATAWYSSELGARMQRGLVNATVFGIEAMAADIEKEVRAR